MKNIDGCVIIPAYREQGRIGAVVHDVKAYIDCVVVVDDGSADNTAAEAAAAGAIVIKHDENSGKGVALETGFEWAYRNEYKFLVTMDADGQHAAEDLPAFLSSYNEGLYDVVIGNRMWDSADMPLVRRVTNKIMSWLLSRRMKQYVPDTQSGYRLYACDVIKDIRCRSLRFNAESEILLILAAKNIAIGAVPIKVIYGDEKSKINPVKDTVRFFRMLRKFRKENKK
jgi:glycosyltransferase involved in cell wall biosynthesis